MGLFKKQQEEMELPPPPPPEEQGALEFPEMPTDEAHIPSEMPDIKSEELSSEPERFMRTGAPIRQAEEEESPSGRQALPSDAPYVNISDFHEVMGSVGKIRDTIKEAEDRISRMAEIKNIEEKELEKWRVQLEDVERKLSYVDEVISKGE